mmetsp:Transcript_52506/g.113679  ORF Transcript_52506/g.113679 Transcript_52506/m.113679 type:complete len:178 (-) Transcript_52506:76-609(-)|eukprot:CAMPEP_0170601438 /NCGR_PEP_ID=MMETSP0224-20130122/17857_1 /TAXON_ID=285029 /ORGANISM="Togula jolla, Strain CCCM 725" /LENGTH=177 /DNA_ID=CAMNT_0010926209 /DNA_START=18 /DNA_END=551 /DNA_ORIENTATION=+
MAPAFPLLSRQHRERRTSALAAGALLLGTLLLGAQLQATRWASALESGQEAAPAFIGGFRAPPAPSSGRSSAVAMKGAAEDIDAFVQNNPVIIFSKTTCPFCNMAKQTLSGLTDFAVVELDQRPDGEMFQDALLKLTGARTVPRVFIGGKCVGGGTDVANLMKSGELAGLVAAAKGE